MKSTWITEGFEAFRRGEYDIMLGTQMILVHLVGDEFVLYLQLVEQTRGVGLVDFHDSLVL